MSRWLVTGAGGMLGSDMVEVLAGEPAVEVTARTRAQLDITQPLAVREAVADHDVVVNTAAWTDVDGAEAQEEQATLINGGAVGVLAEACAAAGAVLIHVSTDYVFAGDALMAYPENAPTQPINAYGRSKLAGEAAVTATLPDSGYIVRTAWLYGENGRNFVGTILSRAQSRPTLNVVDDQRGQPTWTKALARQIVQLGTAALAGRAPAGIYHGTATGDTTWFGLARAAFELAGLDPGRVRPVSSEAFPLPAKRPAFSILAHDRWRAAGLSPQHSWDEQLRDAFSSGVFKAVTP
jgi:dTDP-4-dehydrorhamnose reductase